jgi:hypothetical protein
MDMKRHGFALAALATLVSADAFAQAAGCPTPGLPLPYQRVVNNVLDQAHQSTNEDVSS